MSDLYREAFYHPHSPADPDDLLLSLRKLLPHGTVRLFIARQDDVYRGLCLLATPTVSIGPPKAAIHYLYSDGRMAVSGGLARYAGEFARSHGYGSLTVTNRNGRDAVFSRLIQPYLGRGQPQGTAFNFDL